MTENKFQEVAGTVGCINHVLHEKIDAHVVASRKVTDSISQELNAREVRLHEDMKDYKAETENSLKEFRQEYSQFKEQLNQLKAGQVTWRNKAGREIDKMRDNDKLAEERVAKLVEDSVIESQAASQNSIREVNTEIKRLREQLAARQATDSVISNQVLPATEVNLGNSN
jgi:predicted  nucleic acid-binding Zn-ribbon protein